MDDYYTVFLYIINYLLESHSSSLKNCSFCLSLEQSQFCWKSKYLGLPLRYPKQCSQLQWLRPTHRQDELCCPIIIEKMKILYFYWPSQIYKLVNHYSWIFYKTYFTLFVPLQAKKPNTRINPPRAERGTECPGMAIGCPSVLSNLPCRGPIRTQPTRAQTARNWNEHKQILNF